MIAHSATFANLFATATAPFFGERIRIEVEEDSAILDGIFVYFYPRSIPPWHLDLPPQLPMIAAFDKYEVRSHFGTIRRTYGNSADLVPAHLGVASVGRCFGSFQVCSCSSLEYLKVLRPSVYFRNWVEGQISLDRSTDWQGALTAFAYTSHFDQGYLARYSLCLLTQSSRWSLEESFDTDANWWKSWSDVPLGILGSSLDVNKLVRGPSYPLILVNL